MVDQVTWEQMIKNLILFAPTKAEAKKTVSGGLVRIHLDIHNQDIVVAQGMATDDIISIYTDIAIPIKELATRVKKPLLKEILNSGFTGHWAPEELREGTLGLPERAFDAGFDDLFWRQHVRSSLSDWVPGIQTFGVSFNPDRMRKLALMEPRGQAVDFWFCEWADRSLIRWRTPTAFGAYAPVEMW